MKHNQEMMKQALQIMSGEYKMPGKLLLWAMAIGQWIRVIFSGSILLGLLGYIVFSLSVEYRNNVKPAQNSLVLKEEYVESELTKIETMTEVLELREKALKEQQTILESLIKIRRELALG